MPAHPPYRRTLASLAMLSLLGGCQLYTPFNNPDERAMEDMQIVIATYERSGARPDHLLTVAAARAQPGFEQAIRAMAEAEHKAPAPFVQTRDLQVDGAAGPLPARLYDPAPSSRGQPIVLYFHGGAFVTGSLDSDDLTARIIALQSHAKVLSVAYRLAPEAPLPAAYDDALAAYRWLRANAASLGADPRRIAVAGATAGANLAINVSIAARDAHMPMPVHQLLITPIAGVDVRTPSYIADQAAIPLGRPDMEWAFHNGAVNLADPRVDLFGKADLHNLPPTTLISAEIDPLESDGTFLTYKLQAQGNAILRTLYGGTVHGFFAAGAVVERAAQAESFAAQGLDTTFDKIGNPPPPRAVAARRSHRATRHSRHHR